MSGAVPGSCNIRISSCLLFPLGLVLVGCGSTPKSMTTPTPSAPSYPSTPPVPITWSPSSTLPAPSAQDPSPSGSNDFPLTVSRPTDGQSLTSPARDGLGEANVTSTRQGDGTFGMTYTESGFPPM